MAHDIKNWSLHRPETFTYKGRWIANWFSNMIDSPIEIEGIRYRSVEHYYQSMKSFDSTHRYEISLVDAHKAKRIGASCKTMRTDWEIVKYEFMLTALRVKFNQSDWTKLLLATEDEPIIEWNNWNDKYWGVSIKDNLGMNLLGIALMKVREELNEKFLLKDTTLGKMLIGRQYDNIL